MKAPQQIFLLSLLAFSLPLFVFGSEVNYPSMPGFSTEGIDFFVYLYNLLVYFGCIIAVIAIIYQGVTIFLSQGNMAKISEAKDRIKSAFLGLIILFGSYLILKAINPELAKININIDIPNIQEILNIIPADKTVKYKEIPLGSIIESILMPVSTTDDQRYNYSQVIKQGSSVKKTEEVCYLYDKDDGNTIDRNNDGKIDGKDAVEGLEMSICLDNLLNATIKKIEMFNGNGRELCGSASTAGPINLMKKYIRDGCSCEPCSKWSDITYPPAIPGGLPGWPNGCQTLQNYRDSCTDSEDGTSYDVYGTKCENVCGCCGDARGGNGGCQTTPANPFYQDNSSNYAEHDPCTSRPLIDCARQEMRYRIDGTGLGIGLHCEGLTLEVNGETETFEYSADIKPFIDEDNNKLKDVVDGKSFLTFKQIYDAADGGRIGTFKKYFKNRLDDLEKARKEINNNKDKNVLSLAEFQNLKETSSEEIGTDYLFPDTYDAVGYHTFVCTKYKNNKESNLCIKGVLQELKQEGYAFMPGQQYKGLETLGEGRFMGISTVDNLAYKNDEKAGGWPFNAKRIWNNTLSKAGKESNVYNSGDPATLYILSNPGTADKTKYSKAALKGLIDNSPTGAQCTLKKGEIDSTDPTGAKQIYKESLISSIPIGQLSDSVAAYANSITDAIDDIVVEITNTINSANELADNLPENCKCSNCLNDPVCNVDGVEKIGEKISEASKPCPDGRKEECGGCTDCTQPEHTTCKVSCVTCGLMEQVDSAAYYCVRDKSDRYLIANRDFSHWGAEGNQAPWWNSCLLYHPCCTLDSPNPLNSGDYTTATLLRNPTLTIRGKHCSCYSDSKYIDINNSSCSSEFKSSVYPVTQAGVVCSAYDILYSDSINLRKLIDNGAPVCKCVYVPNESGHGDFTPSDQCYTPKRPAPTYGQGDPRDKPINCTVSELENGFSPDSDCYKEVIKGTRLDNECLQPNNGVYNGDHNLLGPFWDVTSCENNILRFSPKKLSVNTCYDVEEGPLSDDDKKEINNLNPSIKDSIQWNGDGSLTYPGLNCCELYTGIGISSWASPFEYDSSYQGALNNMLSVPSGWTVNCVMSDKNESKLKVYKPADNNSSTPKPLPEKNNYKWNVCPYDTIKKEQARIYKTLSQEPLYSDVLKLSHDELDDCTQDVPGFIQRIEVLRDRLWDLQYAINLSSSDPNRFTMLDSLNVVRTRFNQCIQGFGSQYKEATNYAYLFTCEEGLTAQTLGAYYIYPSFPPENSLLPETSSTNQWGCYPLNALSAEQKEECRKNKDSTNCQIYIQSRLDDYYCCLGAQPGALSK